MEKSRYLHVKTGRGNSMIFGCKIGSMSVNQTFDEYTSALRAQGFSEILERHWPPLTILESHEHEFDAKALVVAGEMWLTVNAETHCLHAGSTFELDAGVPHAERYGSSSATYWVARRIHPSV